MDAVNDISTKMIGYPIFCYWDFFNEPDAGKLMDEHVTPLLLPPSSLDLITDPSPQHESMKSIKYSSSPTFMKDHMCPPNAFRSYITSGTTGPLASWPTPEQISTDEQIISAGGYTGPLNWYKAQIANLNAADEPFIPDELKHIAQPTLLLTATKDLVCTPVMAEAGMKDWVKDLTVKGVDAGHWLHLERPDEVNEALRAFVEA